MQSMESLLDEYQDVQSSVFNRVIGMKNAIEEIMDDNDFDTLNVNTTFLLPQWQEELQSVYLHLGNVVSRWGCVDAYDPSMDSQTIWHTPLECFSMDRNTLQEYIINRYKECKLAEDERALRSLKRQAEEIGYVLHEA